MALIWTERREYMKKMAKVEIRHSQSLNVEGDDVRFYVRRRRRIVVTGQNSKLVFSRDGV